MTDPADISKEYHEHCESQYERQQELADAIAKDIDRIGSIYPSIGRAMYDEPRQRLAQCIAHKIVNGEYHAQA